MEAQLGLGIEVAFEVELESEIQCGFELAFDSEFRVQLRRPLSVGGLQSIKFFAKDFLSKEFTKAQIFTR